MIIEKKYFYTGDYKEFKCRKVLYDAKENLYIIKYILPDDLLFHGIELKKSYTSFGFFWLNKPYVIYEWFNMKNDIQGIYINAAEDISFKNNIISWKDLIVDILCYPDGSRVILDEDELYSTGSKELIKKVNGIKEIILSNFEDILKDLANWNNNIKKCLNG